MGRSPWTVSERARVRTLWAISTAAGLLGLLGALDWYVHRSSKPRVTGARHAVIVAPPVLPVAHAEAEQPPAQPQARRPPVRRASPDAAPLPQRLPESEREPAPMLVPVDSSDLPSEDVDLEEEPALGAPPEPVAPHHDEAPDLEGRGRG